jgi:RNA polymerase sigma-70 factor (ECF subfamily)
VVDPISRRPVRSHTRNNSEEAISMSIPAKAVGSADGRQRPSHDERRPSDQTRDWLRRLRSDGPERVEAVLHVHRLLLRAARFEVDRRRLSLPGLEADEFESIVCESADAALTEVLARLDEMDADRRFSTWVYKFAVVEAAARVRVLVWQTGKATCAHDEQAAIPNPELRLRDDIEDRELSPFLKSAFEVLSPYERHVFVALALNGVPIDVLAERLDSTRADVYETLRQARAKLRGCITSRRALESETL